MLVLCALGTLPRVFHVQADMLEFVLAGGEFQPEAGKFTLHLPVPISPPTPCCPSNTPSAAVAGIVLPPHQADRGTPPACRTARSPRLPPGSSRWAGIRN